MLNKIMKKIGGILKARKKIFIIAFLLVLGPVAWWASRCPVDVESLSIQLVRSSKYGDVTTLSGAKDSAPLMAYNCMTIVTEHLAAKLAQENICLNSTESKERSLLQFEIPRLGVVPLPVPPLEKKPHGVCRITSPWLDLVIERKPVPSVRAIIRFSARQLLADQAVLAGARNVPPGVVKPLTHEEYRQYAFEYALSEIYHKPAAKPIEERVPADLLWAFRRADHSHPNSFPWAASGSAHEAMRIRTDKYAQIVNALIDQCFESEGADLQYNSILDIADLVPIEEYKIETSIVVLLEK